jgi:hypothetical protein
VLSISAVPLLGRGQGTRSQTKVPERPAGAPPEPYGLVTGRQLSLKSMVKE